MPIFHLYTQTSVLLLGSYNCRYLSQWCDGLARHYDLIVKLEIRRVSDKQWIYVTEIAVQCVAVPLKVLGRFQVPIP
jgi:hypothetical protein